MKLFKFWADEDGAVTVDWVVLTASVIGLGFILAGIVGDASDDHADRIGDTLSSTGIATYGG